MFSKRKFSLDDRIFTRRRTAVFVLSDGRLPEEGESGGCKLQQEFFVLMFFEMQISF